MKSLILTTLFAVVSFFAQAQKSSPLSSSDDSQPNFTIPMSNSWLARFEKRQSKMVQKLGLTAEQKKSLDTLNDLYVVKRAVLQEDRTIARRVRIDSIRLLRTDRESKFKNSLTAAQLEKWNEMRKAQKKKTFRKK